MQAINDAYEVYNIEGWSEGYFAIDERGYLTAQPQAGTQSQAFVLNELVESLKESGLRLPILVRFTDILKHRVSRLYTAFNQAKEQLKYQGDYTLVYPIKVNQQHSVVEHLLEATPRIGLEAGSKPELLAILGATTQTLSIICNGYKDAEFLKLALIGQQMGHDVTIVVEKLSELDTLISEIKSTGKTLNIGIRIRLHSVGKGKWQNTGGEKGKFGLTARQVLQAIDKLKAAGLLNLLNLIHFHIGSQIANIRDIQIAIRECARYYCELKKTGIPITTVDVGGGLGVDYEGNGSRSSCSMNYKVDEYARNVLSGFAEICDLEELSHPHIISESGRALTAHHAVLITDVIDIESPPKVDIACADDAPLVTKDLVALTTRLNTKTALECFHDAVHYFVDGQNMFSLGLLSMHEWADLEALYLSLLQKIKPLLSLKSNAHRDVLYELNEKLAHKLFCNFSLFQSLPDAWGIEQIFPVVPLSRLAQPLSMRVIIQDITCDSDGQIKQYTDEMGVDTSLPLPAYQGERDYYLGMFMVGAYQEILGDYHNLFGDTDSAHVELAADGTWQVTDIINGETVADVLDIVHYDILRLNNNYQTLLKQSGLSEDEQASCFAYLQEGIQGYTYFEE
ncbi:biosynthetic arginine decarboxylase [Algibacillus agarilyticus]|uniref:biosynthetic arginine decarboxylase n=1 Tax=Algibacillus agarilyticus TaxID=2234133 RepID=UPI000DCFBCFD|nr:biosynthetic arginine decarboxylase [Algibacillus agarilyticus]